jgi:hypothetical protein
LAGNFANVGGPNRQRAKIDRQRFRVSLSQHEEQFNNSCRKRPAGDTN